MKSDYVRLAKSNLGNLQLTITVLSHELGHVKLLGGKFIYGNDRDMEPLTDLASIFFGFGVFVANSVITGGINWIGRFGYLSSVIEASERLLTTTRKNFAAINNIGYALLQQKKCEEAIDFFTKAVTIDPYYDYAFKRGILQTSVRRS